ncbi:MAG: hypothetical protein ACKV1O_31015 [Saprospiraceae bacterium]
MAKAMMNSREALERWFRSTNHTIWVLYAGHLDKVSQDRAAKLIEQRSDELPIDDSFELLMEMIDLNSPLGGDFTIWSPAKTTQNQGMKSYYRVLPQEAGSVRGISGMPVMAGSGYVSKAEVQGMIEKEKELWELRRDMEDMKAAQEGSVGIGAMMMNTLLADGTIGAVLQHLVAQVAARFGPMPQPRAQVSGLGAQAVPATAGTNELQVFEYTDGVYTALDRMRRFFATDDEFERAITALATQFEAQPDVFKNMLR